MMLSKISSYGLFALLGLLALTTATPISNSNGCETCPAGRNKTAVSGYRQVEYFVNWAIYGRKHTPEQLPASQLTHLLYAFANLTPNGTVFLSDTWADAEILYPSDSRSDVGSNVYGGIKQLFLLKQKHRQLKTLLSIGGWTWSVHFPAVASTPDSRARFASTAVEILQDGGFDGLDIDWEYPKSSIEAADYVLLLSAVRSALDAYSAAHANNYHFQLTAAVPAGPLHYNVLHMAEMNEFLDAWHLMSYDYAGPGFGPAESGHGQNLYPSEKNPERTPFSTDRAVKDYVAAGVPAHKIVLGMPLYGRSFQNTDGIGMSYSGSVQGSWEKDVWDYKELPKPGATMHEDAELGATYSYDPVTRELITFDTPAMASKKAAYIKDNGLGGAMYWESNGDKTGEDSIVATVAKSLGTLEQSQNCLSYPKSRYTNMAKGMPQ